MKECEYSEWCRIFCQYLDYASSFQRNQEGTSQCKIMMHKDDVCTKKRNIYLEGKVQEMTGASGPVVISTLWYDTSEYKEIDLYGEAWSF